MTTDPKGPGTRDSRLRHPLLLLAVCTGGYFLLALLLSNLRFQELYTGNWDLGIFQQAFWSTAHGHPLYEAGDYEMYGFGSLFQVHPAPLLLLLADVYTAVPEAGTLFLVQAAVVSLAAIPLFLLARDVTGSPRKALLAAGLYLVWPPLLAANLYDFHLEAFLPVELFLLFLLWRRGNYLTGFLVAALTFVTIEVGPVLVATVALYFFLPSFRESYRRLAQALAPRLSPGVRRSRWRALGRDLLRHVRQRPVLCAGTLFLASCAAYGILLFLEQDPGLLLAPVVPLSTNPSRPILNAGLYISLHHLPIDVPQKLAYWFVLYALVGFLPFRSPRTQLLVLPWFGYTLVSYSEFTVLGNQYAFLPVAPLFIGVAYALRDLEFIGLTEAWRRWRGTERAAGRPSTPSPFPPPGGGPRTVAGSWRWSPGRATLLLGVVLVACLVLSPADPLVQRSALGNGYQVSYVPSPGSPQVQRLAGLIPPGAVVLASNNLFPLVANDVNAYALLWTTEVPPYLPFNQTHLPTWVFLCSSQSSSVPSWLVPLLTDGHTYQLIGQVPGTSQGTVSLYSRG
jgi:uncharacterized membrane protein